MRLKQLRLAGFKSFAESSTLKFTDARTAIVGPNGCGKSNVIDAIRWVMGESSAKQLRGGAMSDVIFAGSSARRPMSYASVELTFEQIEDGVSAQLKNEFNLYQELSVKRKISRDGKSDYFLNGTRCRKKDIVQVFLGTGLGARSYAVIEQGMISRLVDARPDEMRAHIEEAAGVSKYQAKRRETEQHLTRASENLERLRDIESELTRQIRALERQADKAAQAKKLQSEKHTLTHHHIQGLEAKHWLDTQALIDQQKSASLDLDQVYRARELSEIELKVLSRAQAEQQQTREALSVEHFNLKEALIRLEASEQSREQQMSTVAGRLSDLDRKLNELSQQKTNLQLTQSELGTAKLEQADKLAQIKLRLDSLSLDKPRVSLSDQQQRTHELERKLTQAGFELESHERELERSEHALEQSLHRLEQLAREPSQVEGAGDAELNFLQLSVDELAARQVAQQALIEHLKQDAASLAVKRSDQDRQLKIEEKKLTQWQTELSTLESLEQKAQAQIQSKKPLAKQISLTDQGSEHAKLIDRLLSDWLGAEVGEHAGVPVSGRGVWPADETFESTADQWPSGAYPISDWIETPLLGFLNRVWVVEQLEPEQLGRLPAGGLLLSLDGYFGGSGFCINLLSEQGAQMGALSLEQQQRSQALRGRSDQQLALVTELEAAQQALVLAERAATDALKVAEREHDQLRQDLHAEQRKLTQLSTEQAAQKQIKERRDQDRAQLSQQIKHQRHQITEQKQQLAQAKAIHAQIEPEQIQEKNRLAQLKTDWQQFRAQEQHFKREEQSLSLKLAQLTEKIHASTDSMLSLERQTEQLRRERAQLEQDQERLLATKTEHDAQEKDQLLTKISELSEQIDTAQSELQAGARKLSDEQAAHEKVLKEHELALQNLAKLDTALALSQQDLTRAQEQLESLILAPKETLSEQSARKLLESLASAKEREVEIQAVDARLQKLGQINMAALEDLELSSNRLERLSAQLIDVEQSVARLESAMQQIDLKTRQQFSATFEAINTELDKLFKQVFGGGQAKLTLEDASDWRSGVELMAQPPGKKNARLALLSGGEKALCAMALVFSIFKLNPAPFCVLDEVDAPLDDANIGRFCDLVMSLSDQVQFIYISHNKLAMKMANQLMGVTMPSPGVSSLVQVNLDQASAFTEA